MKKLNITNKMSRSFHKAGLYFKKHSPEILVTAGVVGTVVSTVMACKASTKLDDILEEPKNKIDAIHKGMEDGEIAGVEYTENDGKKDLTIVYTQTCFKIAKLYAPSVAIGAVSVASIFTGHNILRKRHIALAASYAAIDKGFKEYRNRVVERFGKDVDRELRYNIKSEEIEETVIDKNGKEKTVKKTVNIVDPNELTDYARIWYEGNAGWTKDPERNLVFLRQQQAYANNKLQTEGYLFLNEVYEMLGFPKTKAGQEVGWVYDESKADEDSDGFIDFGLYDGDKSKIRFVNGDERSVLLDFNVDGYILDKIFPMEA